MKIDKNNQIPRMLKIFIEIAILLFAVGIAWATLKGKVNRNVRDINRNVQDIEKVETRVERVEDNAITIKGDVREIKVEQKYIRQGIDEIKEKLQ